MIYTLIFHNFWWFLFYFSDLVHQVQNITHFDKSDIKVNKSTSTNSSEIEIDKLNEKMRGKYSCEFKVNIDHKKKAYYTVKSSEIKVDVNSGIKFNISYGLFSISIFSIIYSFTKW